MRYNAVRHAYFTLLILICLSVASGCGGGRGNGVIGTEIDPAAAAGGSQATTPALPVDEYIDPAEILARRGSELTSRTLTGAETDVASGNTVVKGGSLEFVPGGAASGAWAVYCFPDLVDSDFPLRLEFGFDVDAGLPDECYLGLSNYTAECWDWTVVAVPTGSDSLQIPTDIDAVSPGGNLYAVVMVRGEATAVLDTVTLHLDSHYLPAPDGLVATEGTLDGMIRLTWDDPAVTYPELEYTGVMIERAPDPAGPWDELAVVDAAETGYDDAIDDAQGIDPLVPVYYRLRTVLNEIHGAPGLAVSGWLAVPAVGYLMASDDLPDRIEITWEPVPAADYYLLEYRRVESTMDWTLLTEVAAAPEPVFIHMEDSPAGCYFVQRYQFDYRVKAVIGETASLEWSPTDTGSGRGTIEFEASDGTDAEFTLLTWNIRVGSYWNNDWDTFAVYYRNLDGGEPVDWTLLLEDGVGVTGHYHGAATPNGLEAEYGVAYEYRLYGLFYEEVFWEVLASDTGYRAIPDVSNLTASEDDQAGIHLTWDEVADALGYELEYRSTDGGEPADWTNLTVTDALTTTFDHTAAAPAGREAVEDARYEYRARALCAEGPSYNWSNTATGLMGFGTVTGFAASDGLYIDRTVLAWDALNLADAYEIEYRNLDGGEPVDWTLLTEVSDGATTSFSHTETEPAGKGCLLLTHYEYRIRGRSGTEYGPGWAADEGHAGAGPGDWNMDGREPKHQRRSSDTGPESPELLWSLELEGDYAAGSVSLGVDGTAYVSQSTGSLYAVNPGGSIKWSYDEISCGYDLVPYISPDGTILVCGRDDDGTYGDGIYLHSVNPDGTTAWMQYTGDNYGNHAYTPSPVPLPDETIIWAAYPYTWVEYGRLFATYPDGTPRWTYADYFSVIRTPAVGDTGVVYAPVSDYIYWHTAQLSSSYRLHAINPDGTTAWLSDEINLATSPSVGDDGRIYIRMVDGYNSILYCYEPDGSPAWSLGLTGNSMSGLAIAADGTIHTGFLWETFSTDYRAYAVYPDGSVRWIYEQNLAYYESDSSPLIDGAGTIYLGGSDGLHAVNPNGSQKWVYQTDDPVVLSPSIGAGGTVYFPAGGTVYAIGEGTV